MQVFWISSSVAMPTRIFLLFLSSLPISITTDCNLCTFEVHPALIACDKQIGNNGEPEVRLDCLYKKLSGQPCLSCICPVLWMFNLKTEFEYCMEGKDCFRTCMIENRFIAIDYRKNYNWTNQDLSIRYICLYPEMSRCLLRNWKCSKFSQLSNMPPGSSPKILYSGKILMYIKLYILRLLI